jgi:hypothetical protein
MSLVGAWIIDKTDARALAEFGDVLLEFGDDGGLLYTIRGQDKHQTIKLRYQIEGSTIVTDHPRPHGSSAPISPSLATF